MQIRTSINDLAEEISSYRRLFHQNPQTAYEEVFISDFVAQKLTEWDIPHKRGFGKTGLVATIAGKKDTSGKTVGIRADMDALDITEADNKEWKSQIPGKMHACGHDGHTAILLGTAKYLSENNNFDGVVHLIFQPAEEGLRGAQAMMQDGLFREFPCERIFALHNWPYLPRGTISMRPGPIMASADRFSITVLGKGGHAASPHRTIDPITIGAQIVSALQNIVSRGVDANDAVVLSITNFNAGTGAFNVIADKAFITGTLRTFNQTIRMDIKERIHKIAKNVAQAMGAMIEYDFQINLDPTINDPEQTAFCAEIARGLVGRENVDDNIAPSMGGEDFGAMLEQVPGAYVVFGQGESGDTQSNHNHGLHTAQYDFNDAIIPMAIEYWARLVEAALPVK